MSFATPQRPLPGAFLNTPAASRFGPPIPAPVFRPSALSGAQPRGQAQQSSNLKQQPQQDLQARQISQNRSIQPIARAARTINDVLQQEANFPDLDSYVRRTYPA